MAMNHIDIFYIATGVYFEYFGEFLRTLPNFFPGVKKRVHIISDKMKEYDGYNDGTIEVNVIYQLDMPYPIIPLLKTLFVKAYMPEDAEYIFYFDADTIFMEKSPEYWVWLASEVERGEILAANHPGNLRPDNYLVNYESTAYVPQTALRFSLIASFWGGRKDKILKFCDQMNEKIRADLTFHKDNAPGHYIPPLFDQDYMNRVVQDSDGLSFLIRYFVLITWLANENDVFADNFVEQKYDIHRKFEKKNMDNR